MRNEEQDKPLVAVDFDGVLNKYDGWRGENHLPEPQSGVQYFLRKLSGDFNVVIFTCRDNQKVREWLEKHELDVYVTAVTMTKPQAYAYIDDRAINYEGNYSEVLRKLDEFKVWWQKE